MQYDSYKVQAVLNEINGYDHSGPTKVGTPAIFGMNFQTVSTAEKLPTSDGSAGGYLSGRHDAGPAAATRARFRQRQVGEMVDDAQGSDSRQHRRSSFRRSTASRPHDPAALTRIHDGPIIDALNAAWKPKSRHDATSWRSRSTTTGC